MHRRLSFYLARCAMYISGCVLAPAVLTAPAYAQEVVQGGPSAFRNFVSAQAIEEQASQEYLSVLQKAQQNNTLLSPQNAQLRRAQKIALQLIPHTRLFHPRALEWRWQVNMIQDDNVNAFCMPGGKVIIYTGIIDKLALNDDEIATVLGHEIAHALREHARAQAGKNTATQLGGSILSQALGLGDLGRVIVGAGSQLLSLRFSRQDETDADLVGLELAARAGFDPRAGISLWKKMSIANHGQPPQWLSTHPSGKSRITDIEKRLPVALKIFAKNQPEKAMQPYVLTFGQETIYVPGLLPTRH